MNMIYEVPFKFYMNPSDVVFILLIFIYAFPVINKIKMEIYHINISNERAYEKFFEIFRRVFYIVVTSFCILGTVIQLHILCKTFGVYKRGDYEVVEGYVDNFDPAENHIPEETFEINGVKFFYTDELLQPGYNMPNGLIKGNGQHLKIGYVYYNQRYGNVILSIEKMP